MNLLWSESKSTQSGWLIEYIATRIGMKAFYYYHFFGEWGRESKKNHEDPIEFIPWLNKTCKKTGRNPPAEMKKNGQGRVIDSFYLSSSLAVKRDTKATFLYIALVILTHLVIIQTRNGITINYE